MFRNLPPNPYHLVVAAQGFQTFERDVDVRSGVPIDLELPLKLAGATSTVEVVGHAEDLLERDPTAHTDIDQSLIDKLPLESSSSGLNQVITLASPGVVADSNGFFHPIGDHAQTQFSIDNQPVTDQQSRLYSNQISPDAVQSMEVITGVAPAEYGDKSSLVVHIVTKSGLDQPKPTGSVSLGYGSFRSPTGELNIGAGIAHRRQLSVGLRRCERIDSSIRRSSQALHDTGDSGSFFDRLDFHPSDTDTLHLNLQAAKSGFDVPNTLRSDRARRSTRTSPHSTSRPGYSRVIGSKTLFTANGFVRQDHLTYPPSADPFDDTPATVSQDRTLTNIGVKADVSYTAGNHNVKVGGDDQRDEAAGEVHVRHHGPDRSVVCGRRRQFQSGVRAVRPDERRNAAHLRPVGDDQEQAVYVQDDIKAGDATFKLGVRVDHYDGLTAATLVEPRLGVSYAVPGSGTVLRASYGRTLETPYNENLLLSRGVGLNGLFGVGNPPPPGKRNQVELGVQQGFGSLGRRRLRLLQQAHRQRLRLRRAVRHADRVSGRVGSFADRRLHRPAQPRRARRLQRVRGDGAHERDLLAARHGRDSARAAGRRFPDRPRSEVQLDHEPAVRVQQADRRMGGAQLAVRLGAGRRRRAGAWTMRSH